MFLFFQRQSYRCKYIPNVNQMQPQKHFYDFESLFQFSTVTMI